MRGKVGTWKGVIEVGLQEVTCELVATVYT
jgi:hypothetical protein